MIFTLLIVLLLVGVAYWAASALGAPHPLPTLILVVGVVIVLVVLIGGLGEGSGRDLALLIRA